MIGKVKIGKSFPGICRYVFRHDKESSVLAAEGVRMDSAAHMSQDFNQQRALRPGLGNAVLHVALALHPDDAVGRTRDELSRLLLEVGQAYVREMKLTNTQWALVQHTDRPHAHAHLVVNRVDNSGRTISDRFSGKDSRDVCQKLEQQFKLTVAEQKGRDEVREPGPTRQQEQAVSPRQKRSADWQRVRHEVANALRNTAPFAGNWDELQAKLTRYQIQVHLSTHQKKDGPQGYGVVFEKDGHRIKGSEVAKEYSAGKLQQAFVQYQAQAPGLAQAAGELAKAFEAESLNRLFQEQARQAREKTPETSRQAPHVGREPSPVPQRGGGIEI